MLILISVMYDLTLCHTVMLTTDMDIPEYWLSYRGFIVTVADQDGRGGVDSHTLQRCQDSKLGRQESTDMIGGEGIQGTLNSVHQKFGKSYPHLLSSQC